MCFQGHTHSPLCACITQIDEHYNARLFICIGRFLLHRVTEANFARSRSSSANGVVIIWLHNFHFFSHNWFCACKRMFLHAVESCCQHYCRIWVPLFYANWFRPTLLAAFSKFRNADTVSIIATKMDLKKVTNEKNCFITHLDVKKSVFTGNKLIFCISWINNETHWFLNFCSKGSFVLFLLASESWSITSLIWLDCLTSANS